jgi:hypothetical protein
MSKRSGEIVAYVLGLIAIGGFVQYFRYHQFHWWLLIIPATSIPLVIMQQRRQKHWDDLRSQRQQSLSNAKAAEQVIQTNAPSKD